MEEDFCARSNIAARLSNVKTNAPQWNDLVMNATKDGLKSAPGFKYDSTTTSWMPDNKK
jgi:hypothetical protein